MLLHGVGHHWQAWRPVIERLRERFDVIACDTPGFGASEPLPSSMEPTITSYADAFEWFFAELGLERPHVAGQLDGRRDRAGAGPPPRRRLGDGVLAAGLLDGGPSGASRSSHCSRSRAPRGPAATARRGAARTRTGRVALFSQTFGYPARLPAEEAVATLRDAWASPVVRQGR